MRTHATSCNGRSPKGRSGGAAPPRPESGSRGWREIAREVAGKPASRPVRLSPTGRSVPLIVSPLSVTAAGGAARVPTSTVAQSVGLWQDFAVREPPQSRDLVNWAGIQHSQMAHAYVFELYRLAVDAASGCNRVFDAAPPPQDDSSYLKVDHEISGEIYRVLNCAARLSSLISPRPKRRNQSSAQFAVQQARIVWLRGLLGEIELRETLRTRVRNSLEHYDEYLDKTALRFSREKIDGRIILPLDMTLGRENTLPLDSGDTLFPLRVYLAKERTFVNCGEYIDLNQIAIETGSIVAQLESWYSDLPVEGGSGERGSLIFVLTEKSFDGPPP